MKILAGYVVTRIKTGVNACVVLYKSKQPLCLSSSECLPWKRQQRSSIYFLQFSQMRYPQTLVMDNAMTFTSQDFQTWCKARGIIHLKRATYLPASNGVAERLVQIFKKSLRKSKLHVPLREALQEFPIQYQRTPSLIWILTW